MAGLTEGRRADQTVDHSGGQMEDRSVDRMGGRWVDRRVGHWVGLMGDHWEFWVLFREALSHRCRVE